MKRRLPGSGGRAAAFPGPRLPLLNGESARQVSCHLGSWGAAPSLTYAALLPPSLPSTPESPARDSPLPTTSCGVRTSFLIMLQIPARNDGKEGKEGRAERGRWRSPGLGGVGTGTATLWVMPSAQLCARRGCLCHADVTETASAVCLRAVPRRRHRSVSVTARQVHPSSPSPYAHCNEPTIWPSIFDMLLLCLQ